MRASAGVLLCAAICLACLVRAGSADEVRTYDVTVPEEWKDQLAVGEVSLIGAPFYGGAHPFFGFAPVVRVSYSLKNVSSDPLYVLVDYRSESKGFGRNAQTQVCYALAPGEERQIDALAPVAWQRVPATFFVRMQPYQRLPSRDDGVPQHRVVTIDPLPAFQFPTADVSATVENDHFTVDSVRLAHSEEQGNVLVVEASNETDRDLPIGIYVAVNDPGTSGRGRADSGHFFEAVRRVPAHSRATIAVPYTIPGAGPDPLLAFTVFEPPPIYLPAEDLRRDHEKFRSHYKSNYDLTLISYGLLNLRRAADRGECVLPEFVPVEERVRLTAQTTSEHFVFHYRPASYAEEHLQSAIREREQAYQKLNTALEMDLPAPVRIDLYPDMGAKGLGSGTTWTPANTVSNLHIAEVYNQRYQCDPNHELAHIFSYHFPGHADLGGEQHAPGRGLMEGFAEYFESHADPAQARQAARSMLRSGKLAPLAQLLVSSTPTRQHEALIHFLLKKDVEKFKQFYVRVLAKPTPEDVRAASKEIYGKPLEELEAEWHRFLRGDH